MAAAVAEGMWAVVSAAAKVAMALAHNSGNGGAGKGGGNRSSGKATTINQTQLRSVVVAAAAVAAVVAAVKWQGQIVAAASMVITQFTLEGVLFHMGIQIGDRHNILAIFLAFAESICAANKIICGTNKWHCKCFCLRPQINLWSFCKIICLLG